MADEDFLQQFREQLVHWIEQEMETGRIPFRRVETGPPLLTPQPPPAEHLVLWINRASAMAGGLILLPRDLAEDILEGGAALAEAVGLDHFAVWDRQRVSIWQRQEDDIRLQQEWPLGGKQSASALHRALRSLLERLKVLSVLQSAGNTAVSSWWLTNLLHLCLLDVTPQIEQALRTAVDDGRRPWNDLARAARGKALLVLFRLVAVIHARVLGRGIQPEKLERALGYAIGQLPAPIDRHLVPAEGEPPLPEAAAVRFHHLWHRLQQLEKQINAPLLLAALKQLTPDLAPLAPPGPGPQNRPTGRWLAVQPLALAGDPPDALVADAPLAAWHTLCAWLEQRPAAAICVNRLEELPPQQRYERITAVLTDRSVPDSRLRGNKQAQLRLSWPSRRFRLAPTAPAWSYDFIHLLGLAAPAGELQLQLPDSLLQPTIGRPLWELVCSEFCCREMRLEDGNISLRLQRIPDEETVCQLENGTIRRDLDWNLLRQRSLRYLACALDWPDPLFAMLCQNELRLTEEAPPPAELWREQILFWHSSWGRNLAAWCGFNPARARSVFAEGRAKDLPPVYPTPERLQALRNVAWQPDSELPPARELDEELAFWLGERLADPDLPRPNRTVRENAPAPARQGQLAETIRERILIDGLPLFPEHYLYDHYRPALKSWRFSGPLKEKERFFSSIELQGPDGESIRTDCEPLAGCLLLASARRQSVELPTDPQVAADILQRYLHDLARLRRELLRQCRLEAAAAPDRLVNRLWREWGFPPWDLVRQVAALFSPTNPLE
ncbi:hypothetical protein [Geothermobacter ehrlichii]|nr:hypothetical protein [Geothermobacter ehrlichii]